MSCHTLCPSCGNCLGEYYDFIMLVKKGYYKTLKIDDHIHTDKLQLTDNVTKEIGFIFDAVGLNLICCRMHILGAIDVYETYK